ncbi:MAG: TonB-dependent receptor, partial [Flavobacteriaceae bacterium]
MIVLLSCIFSFAFSQDKKERYTLSGTITESSSKETLIGVNILIPEIQAGTISNEYGFYSITLPEGSYEVIFSNLGFESQSKTISLNQNIRLDLSLSESVESLDEVIITSDVERLNIKTPQMSVNALTVNTIKKIPVVLGETDIIKAITLLPGVTSAGEGSSGFNVRGGAADQNLILLDEATLYSDSHLFGFFSVFNPDAIKDLKLYKG